ncbi:excisionase family DNA binding protein [Rhodococcus sp. SMB37]|uniref:antitoxin Xre/MbcA/ParS toxin-binding domain-containing protein n=1 Tax=Rhodococcus sp. SMB37 TaxID=2512213 RepID=UPI00104327C5|nr:antitoxin Xre/MbcA/ParS toxin-binding domain-containing protein [Rhodococcus sp. SMB37]TCN53573.1 excisionase family DNA binding protein [Rhodococcus sp. SMB37]
MSRGPESEPQDLRPFDEVGQLLEDIADHNGHFVLLALPKSAPSFVADLRAEGTSFEGVDPGLWKTDLHSLRAALDTPGLAEAMRGIPVPDAAALILGAADETPTAMRVVNQKILGVFVRQWMAVAAGNSDDAELADAEAAHVVADDGWGPVISAAEAEGLERQNRILQVEQRREQLADSFTRPEAADLLGVAPQTVSDMIAERRLVAIKDGRAWKLPAWQFTPDLAEPVLPDVGRLAQEFPGGVVSLSRWMSRPNENFGGRTPAQEMTRDSARVFAAVRSLMAV